MKEDVTFKVPRKVKLMAVYTKLTNKDFLTIQDLFSIGKILKRTGIKKGIENTNYLVKTNKKKNIF